MNIYQQYIGGDFGGKHPKEAAMDLASKSGVRILEAWPAPITT